MKLTKGWEMFRIYISKAARYKKYSLYHSLVLKLKEMGMAEVTMTRCLEGYEKSKNL
ncbi:DUF190 domain-containing protein [Clostridium sp. JNZ X4-2]